MSVCMLSNFFQITMTRTVFVRFSQNLAHVIMGPIRKKLEQIFEILSFEILHLDLSLLCFNLGRLASLVISVLIRKHFLGLLCSSSVG